MDTQKLHDLIDKAIGKSGPLRTPAWWMRRVLNDVVDKILELKTWTGDAMLKLESRVNVLVANCIKSIPEYTYVELKKLKDKGLLIPGQKYVLTGYVSTVSAIPDGLDGTCSAQSNQPARHVILTALSPRHFSEDALIAISASRTNASFRTDGIIKYHFDRNPHYFKWSFRDAEGVKHIKVKDDNGITSLYFDHIGGLAGAEYAYYSDGNVVYKFDASIDIWAYLKYGNTLFLADEDGNTVKSVNVVDIIDDSFRGIIYYYRIPHFNITLPCDEFITFSFDVAGQGAISISQKPILLVDNGRDFSENVHIEPYVQGNAYYLPRIYISGSAATQQSTSKDIIRIERHSTNIVIQGSKCHVGRWCNNLRIYQCRDVVLGLGVTESIISCYNGIIEGNSTNLNIAHAKWCRIGQHNDYLKISTYSDIVVATAAFYLNTEIFNITHKDSRHLIMVALDSNGNIRQWNPADFVDAIEPEEQTTETTEE